MGAMGKKSVQKPPDYTELINATRALSAEQLSLGRDQLAWSREQDANNRAILERVLGVQLPIMEATFQNAQADRQRYEQVFQPIEDNLIKEFQNYATPERFDKERGRAIADVNTNFDAQRRNALTRLESYGIDPSTTRNQALDVGMRIAQASTAAGAADAATQRVENTGRALRAEAINIGRGLPSQVAASYGQSIGAGQAGLGGALNTATTGANLYNSSQGWYGGAMGGYGQAGNLMNIGYQNALGYSQARQNAAGMGLDILGTLGGAAIGAAPFMAEGGVVPAEGAIPMHALPNTTDRKPIMATPGEYVVPKDVVEWKGQEFFEKLKNKSREDVMAIEIKKRQPQGPASAIPMGA